MWFQSLASMLQKYNKFQNIILSNNYYFINWKHVISKFGSYATKIFNQKYILCIIWFNKSLRMSTYYYTTPKICQIKSKK